MIRPRRLPIVTRVTRLATTRTERLASGANLEAGRTRGGAEGNALELIGRSLPTSDRASDSDSQNAPFLANYGSTAVCATPAAGIAGGAGHEGTLARGDRIVAALHGWMRWKHVDTNESLASHFGARSLALVAHAG
jgi:hypothetical protein